MRWSCPSLATNASSGAVERTVCKEQRQTAPSVHAYLDDEVNAGRTPRLQRARVAELEANRGPRSTPAGAEGLGARSTARAQL